MDQAGGRATGRSRRAKATDPQAETAERTTSRAPIMRDPAEGFGTPVRGTRPGAGSTWATGTPTYGPEHADEPIGASPQRTRQLQIGTRRYGPY